MSTKKIYWYIFAARRGLYFFICPVLLYCVIKYTNELMKEKLVLEYSINSSPKVLYARLSTPGGLSEWFADDVNVKGDTYSFFWEGNEQKAEAVLKKENRYIRFRWKEDPEAFFEFRINVDELTKDVALVITDLIDEDDVDGAKELWDSQVSELKHVLGL